MSLILEKCLNPADPNRCQGIFASGQCAYLAIEGSKHCARHGGNQVKIQEDQKNLRLYRLHLHQERLDTLADHTKAKSLREELAILRMTLEALINDCGDTKALVMAHNRISDLVVKIEKVTSSCQRLEFKIGDTLDKNMIIQFANEVIEIISKYILKYLPDEVANEVLGKIGDDLMLSLESLSPLNGKENA